MPHRIACLCQTPCFTVWNPWSSIMMRVWLKSGKTKGLLYWEMCGLRAAYHLQACCSRSNFGAWMVQIPHIFGHAAILKHSSYIAPRMMCYNPLTTHRSTWIGSIVPGPLCDASPMQTQNACVWDLFCTVPSFLPFNLMMTLIKIVQDSRCLGSIKTLVFTTQSLF